VRILELFTHPGCISKREGAAVIKNILKEFPDISFREVDILEEPKKTSQLGVRMSPTLVLDGKIISVGIPESKILKAMLNRSRIGVSHV
jgi:predicted DsbA family dithiol-disulfide isomerase